MNRRTRTFHGLTLHLRPIHFVVASLTGMSLLLISCAHGERAAERYDPPADAASYTIAKPERISWSNPTPQPVLVLNDGRAIVPAQRPWLDTDLVLRPGQEITVRAEGQVRGCLGPSDNWAFGPWQPDGMIYDGRLFFALVGRLQSKGQEETFVLGSEGSFTARMGGALHLGVNDIAHFDNEGAYLVRVSIDGKEVDFNKVELTPVPTRKSASLGETKGLNADDQAVKNSDTPVPVDAGAGAW